MNATVNPYEGYTAEELCRKWNKLETQKFSDRLEAQMDEIVECLLEFYGVEGWDKDGNVTARTHE